MRTEPENTRPPRWKRPGGFAGLTVAALAAVLGLVAGCASPVTGTANRGPDTTTATPTTDPGTTDGQRPPTAPTEMPATTTQPDDDDASDAGTTTDTAAASTEQVLIDPFDSDGNLRPEYHIDTLDPVDVFGCDASLSAVSDNVFECAPYAAHTNVCWPGDSPYELLCSHGPTSYSLFLAVSETPLPAAPAVSQPVPWQLELGDGSVCAVRYGGAWGDGPGDSIGYYSCDGPSAFVLAAPASHPVDTTGDVWTVQTGQLGTDPSTPATTTQAVTVAYFAAFAAGASR